MNELFNDNPHFILEGMVSLFCVVLLNLVMWHQTMCWLVGLMASLSMKLMACMNCGTIRPVFSSHFVALS